MSPNLTTSDGRHIFAPAMVSFPATTPTNLPTGPFSLLLTYGKTAATATSVDPRTPIVDLRRGNDTLWFNRSQFVNSIYFVVNPLVPTAEGAGQQVNLDLPNGSKDHLKVGKDEAEQKDAAVEKETQWEKVEAGSSKSQMPATPATAKGPLPSYSRSMRLKRKALRRKNRQHKRGNSRFEMEPIREENEDTIMDGFEFPKFVQ